MLGIDLIYAYCKVSLWIDAESPLEASRIEAGSQIHVRSLTQGCLVAVLI